MCGWPRLIEPHGPSLRPKCWWPWPGLRPARRRWELTLHTGLPRIMGGLDILHPGPPRVCSEHEARAESAGVVPITQPPFELLVAVGEWPGGTRRVSGRPTVVPPVGDSPPQLLLGQVDGVPRGQRDLQVGDTPRVDPLAGL